MMLKTALLLLICAGIGLSGTVLDPCVDGPLSGYLGGSCQYEGVVFSGFDRTVGGNAKEYAPSDITLYFSHIGNSVGISFEADWHVEGPKEGENTVVDMISFVVSGELFSGVTLKALAAGKAESNHNHINEDVNGYPAMLQVGNFGPNVPSDPPTWYTDSASLASPQSTLSIVKQIHLGEGNGEWGRILRVSQTFDYSGEGDFAIPEPGTFALIGLALASLGLFRKRIRP